MKWVIDAHYAREHALRFEFSEHCFNRLARTGQGKRTGAVERGDRNRAIMFVDQRLCFVFAEADREHLSFAPGATLHELGAERGNARALFQGKQTCHTGCGNFTHAMAGDRRRLHAPRFPQFRQSDLHRENGRLRHFGTVQLRILLGTAEFFEQRKIRDAAHRRVALFDHPAKDRFAVHQLAAHAPPLRPLSTHHEGDTRRGFGARRERSANLHAVLLDCESVELLNQIGY